MTAPDVVTGRPTAGFGQPAPSAPKQQAVTFAIELAKIRGTSGVAGERVTTAAQLVADARTIAAYLGSP